MVLVFLFLGILNRIMVGMFKFCIFLVLLIILFIDSWYILGMEIIFLVMVLLGMVNKG